MTLLMHPTKKQVEADLRDRLKRVRKLKRGARVYIARLLIPAKGRPKFTVEPAQVVEVERGGYHGPKGTFSVAVYTGRVSRAIAGMMRHCNVTVINDHLHASMFAAPQVSTHKHEDGISVSLKFASTTWRKLETVLRVAYADYATQQYRLAVARMERANAAVSKIPVSHNGLIQHTYLALESKKAQYPKR